MPRRILAILVVSALTCPLHAQTASEIITKAEDALKGASCKGRFAMTVTTPDYTRRMEMDAWWVGNEKALIVIRSPKKDAGNKTLKIGNEMWSYLRNTETTIKIPPSMMLQSWNGSDFTNDDLVRESNLARDYAQKILLSEKCGDAECWKIELIPHPDAPVVWGKLYYWVRKKDYLASAVEYYDESGKRVRSMVFSNVRAVGGRTIPTTWTMINDSKPGNRTQFEILTASFDVKIPAGVFSLRELEKGE